MKMKLIVALVDGAITDVVIDAARTNGATGVSIITSVRGEGLKPQKTFLGLDLTQMRDTILFVVPEACARNILEQISEARRFNEKPRTGIAFQIAIEDTVGGLDTVDQAIDKMRKYQVSSLVVECRDEDDELGVLVIADIARGVRGGGEWCLEVARQTELACTKS